MKQSKLALLGLLAAIPAMSGQSCASLADLFGPGIVVTLVNNGDYDVVATIAYSDNPGISESDLENSGTEVEITIPEGESRSFRRNCVQMRAVMVKNAELQVIGGFGPTTQSEVIREGQGSPSLVCQGFLSFTFDHNDSTLDFDVDAN